MNLCFHVLFRSAQWLAPRQDRACCWTAWVVLVIFLALATPVSAQLRFVTVVPAAANTSFPDEDGEYPAYIEIRSLETGILSGHFLTDQPNVPNKWQVPAGYILTSGQTIRIFASGKDRKPAGPGGVLHTSFTYDCSVPYCGLFNSQQTLVHTFADRADRCGCTGLALIGPGAVVRTLIPKEDLGTAWTVPGYDDKNWIRGKTGVGYEVGSSPYGAGLVLCHTLDRLDVVDNLVKDVSGPTLHNGAIAGALPTVPGQIAQGLDFKASAANFVRVPHHAELDPGAGSFAVAVWFRALRGSALTVGTDFSEVLVSKQGLPGTTGQTGGGWSIYRNQTGTFVQVISGGVTRSVALGVTSANAWHHAVLVVDRGSNQLVGYLDGKRMGVAPLSTGTAAPGPIGSSIDLLEGRDVAGSAPFAGVLDDVAVWSRSMTDAQIAQLFNAGQNGKSFMDGTQFPGGDQLYAGLIGTDVLTQMKGVRPSAYIRVPFNVASVPSLATGLKLRVHYDDGFIAYLNGAEVARRNSATVIDIDSAADKARPDAAALAAESIDLTAYIGLLKPGGNVLAFHAFNSDADADRFLLHPIQLCLQVDRTTTPGGECIKETNGKDFWIAFPQNYAQEPDTPLRLSVCIAGPPQTKGVVEIPGLQITGFPRNFTIPASGAVTLSLPPAVELAGPDNIEPKGVHITASADVAVYGTSRMDYTTDTFLALPNKCLGIEYLVSSYKNLFTGIPVLNGTQFAIVAVANFTEVTIIPSETVGGHPAKQPYMISLNRGDTYQLRNEAGQPADLTGTQIFSTKPVAAFGSHRCANVQSLNQFFCDTVVEELLPISSWGSSFFLVPLATRKSDTVRVLSAGNDNLVTVTTSGGSESFTLQRGEFKDLVLELPTRIVCRQPSTVMQFANSSDADHVDHADPFMAMIQPSTTWLNQYRICTPPENEFENHYINLVATTQAFLDNTLINGLTVAAWNPADISKGALPSGAVFARIRLKPGTAYHIEGRAPLGLTAYGFSEFDSYGYPGGMRFVDTSAPIIVCPEEITVNCASIPGAAGCMAPVPNLTFTTDFFDDCTPEGQLAVTQTPEPGQLLQPGTHEVTIVAADAKGNKSQCTVKLIVEPKWEQQQFGATVASNPSLEATVWGTTADPDQDGLLNSDEKALGTNPNRKDSLLTVLELSTEQDQESSFLMIRLPRLTAGGTPGVELEGLGALDGAPWLAGPDVFEELPTKSAPMPGGQYEKAAFKARPTQEEGDGSRIRYFLRLKPKN